MDIIYSGPGTYVIIIELNNSKNIMIGKMGYFFFEKGYYLYVGSAHGPGGLRSRIKRHLRKDKSRHWHIDYLMDKGSAIAVLFSSDNDKKECNWASRFNYAPDLSSPVNGFGSSDCACPSHLFFSKKNPGIIKLKNILKESVDFITVS